ncbi:synaptogyrin-1-like [Corticium candelabrum]|uniref:synaptogyrin-1-like n=1 Tax=Corticium candelabrum TaxID=121492 RepID=UPI002E253E22|nr:synaptogyrin-1-like [Corticium candelabrum]
MADSSKTEKGTQASDSKPEGDGTLLLAVKLVFRALALLSAIVVTGLIADKLEDSLNGFDFCVFGLTFEIDNGFAVNYSSDKNACRYGIAVGVITIIFAILFIIMDIILFMCGVGSLVIKKVVSIADLVCSCLLALLWVVAFIYLLDKWNKAGPKDISVDGRKISDRERDVEVTIAFSIIGGLIWVLLAIIAAVRTKRAA